MWLITQQKSWDQRFRSFYAGPPHGSKGWWVDKLGSAIVFASKEHAQAIWAKLKFNFPQVITQKEAMEIVAKQNKLLYTPAEQRISYDRSLSPISSSRSSTRPSNTGRRPTSSQRWNQAGQQRIDFDYEHELDHLLGLDGWGSGGY